MSSMLRSIAMLLTSIAIFASANPVSSPELVRRVSNSAFVDWSTNIVFLGGSQSYGGWIPPDGTWYQLHNIQCLDMPAYAVGPCDSSTIDKIGVATGNGPCSFVGINGWSATIQGAAGEGYTTVGPPQRIVLGKCGS